MTPAGEAIEIRYSRNLKDSAGHPAHAATFIRQRLIVLDSDLRRNPREHRRILAHELFHFVWVRLGNTRRRAWEDLLLYEWNGRMRGEAGWSAEWRKNELSEDDVRRRTRKWREYCCEGFCDTGACLSLARARAAAKQAAASDTAETEVTLSPKRLAVRLAWFAEQLPESLPI